MTPPIFSCSPFWIFALWCALLCGDSNAAKLEKFEVGKIYRLTGLVSDLIPISPKFCNISGSTKEVCHLGVGSTFKVVKIDSEAGKVTLAVHYGFPVNTKFRECKTFFGNFDETEYCKEASKIAATDVNTLAGDGLMFVHDAAPLLPISEEYTSSFSIGLKAVFIPQKIYGRNYQHSTNQTIGIAISGAASHLLNEPGFHLLPSADMGIGFNQVTIESGGTLVERIGLSVFYGYEMRDTRDDRKLGIGVYIGVDYVQLQTGELFAGLNRRHRPWLGLMLSTPLN